MGYAADRIRYRGPPGPRWLGHCGPRRPGGRSRHRQLDAGEARCRYELDAVDYKQEPPSLARRFLSSRGSGVSLSRGLGPATGWLGLKPVLAAALGIGLVVGTLDHPYEGRMA